MLPLMIAGGGGGVIHVASQLGHVAAAGRPIMRPRARFSN